MSGVIVRTENVLANDVLENVIAGSTYEFARANSFVSMGLVQSATGLFVTILAGGTVVAEEFEPPIETGAGVFPQTNEDFYFNTFAVTGDRLVIRARNSTAGALDIRLVVQITDV